MFLLTQRIPAQQTWDEELELSFELRQKTRLRTQTRSGVEVGLFLDRSRPLSDGDCLRAEDGRVVRVCAAAERLIQVSASESDELARAAYHLGNRHVALEIGPGWLRLARDPVLLDMLERHFEVRLQPLNAAFFPESGAYGAGHHQSHRDDAAFHYAPRLHQFDAGSAS